MRNVITVAAFGVILAAAAAFSGASQRSTFRVRLDGFQEVLPVSTTGTGSLELRVAPDGHSLDYELRYDDLVGDVAQAHVHFGRPAINGGIMVFLCSNVGSPVPTQPCPGPHSGEVSGTLDADDVIGPAAQGIDGNEFAEVVDALRSHTAYGNVHSSLYPAGEIRGNFIAPPPSPKRGNHHGDHDD